MAKKILVVDDNLKLRENLSDILGEKGYKVKSIGATDDIWEVIKEEAFDLMVLDLIMPEKNTITILGGLKSACPGTRIIIYSGYEEYGSSSYVRIADAFISKSKGPESLLAAMKNLLGT